MNFNLQSLFKRENIPQLVLGVVCALYILGDVRTPHAVAKLAKTHLGVIVMMGLVIMVAYHSHPIVGVLTLVAFYELYKRSHKHHVEGTVKHAPVDHKRPHLNVENQYPVTLEEKVVKQMAPWVMNENNSPASYKPVLDSDMGSSDL
jgi:hypothetical protein